MNPFWVKLCNMSIPIFQLERVQSLYENTVDYNLTESGFHPYTLNELLDPEELEALANVVLGYGQTNGSIPLRRAIAALYEGIDQDNILVTNGSAEANFVACHTMLSPGDHVVLMVPNYMQWWGAAREIGCRVDTFPLLGDNGWQPDLQALEAVVRPDTKMIVLCNPNNPTGYTLTEGEMKEIVRIAESCGAWIYADEIYRGAELDGQECPSFHGWNDRVVVNGGLSKAYALPGLRIGWLAGPRSVIDRAWAYRDYTSITSGILSHKIAELILRPTRRRQILQRNRKMLNANLAFVQQWLRDHGSLFHFIPPKAGGMAFMKYDLPINSTELSDWLRIHQSVFIVAGDCFGMDHFLRLGIGAEQAYLQAGLQRLDEGLQNLIKARST